MNLLIVGGAGYIGSHMVKHLAGRGHQVTVFDNLSRGHASAVPQESLWKGDLLSPLDLHKVMTAKKFDAVLHFAAFCYVGESVGKPREYFRNNVVGTMNLLDAMLDAGVRNVVFSSSCSTYGAPATPTISEEHPQVPINPYGASKLMVERILADYSRAYGLNSVALRYFNAAGSDPEGVLGEEHDPETHLIPLALLEADRTLRGGDPHATTLTVFGDDYNTPDGTCIRDYVHVHDLASAHLTAAEKMKAGDFKGARAYNLGTDRGFSVLEVIESCRRVTGAPIEFNIGRRRPGDPDRLVATSEKARRELDWQPYYVELDKIVGTAWRWFSRKART